MLEELIVHNYALIDKIQVTFSEGLNILSGETGAGKSLLAGALGLLLGLKGDIKAIREGYSEAMVSGVIQVKKNPDAVSWLKERDITTDDGVVIVKRILKATGRTSIYIQSVPVTRADLGEFASFLFDMHGQHEHQSLLVVDNHRKLVDKYGGHSNLTTALFRDFNELSTLKKQYQKLLASERERLREIDILTFSVKEIEEANLEPGEEEELEAQRKILSQHEKLFSFLDSFHNLMAENKDGGLSNIRQARSELEEIISIDPHLSSLANRLDNAFYEIEDITESIRDYQMNIQFNPDRLEECEQRLSVIHKLQKKYGNSVGEILEYYRTCKTQLDVMENWEEQKEQLTNKIAVLEQDVLQRAQELSQRRKKAALLLQDKVQSVLKHLGMPKAVFRIEVTQKLSDQGKPLCGAHGIDQVEFVISANQGEKAKPLRSIASGGEISRIMLAIKSVLVETDNIQSLIFDEIDTGIGGEVAVSVGEHLQKLGQFKQVLCITHLASIAARARSHFKIEKLMRDNRTVTEIKSIQGQEKVKEIARMLAGDTKGETSLSHAKEILEKFQPV